MNNDKAIFEDWEMEKLNELVKYISEKNLKKQALKEWHKQGFAKGHTKGRVEEIEKGHIEGSKEKPEECIKNMLKENIDIELISKITNKSKEEILKLK